MHLLSWLRRKYERHLPELRRRAGPEAAKSETRRVNQRRGETIAEVKGPRSPSIVIPSELGSRPGRSDDPTVAVTVTLSTFGYQQRVGEVLRLRPLAQDDRSFARSRFPANARSRELAPPSAAGSRCWVFLFAALDSIGEET